MDDELNQPVAPKQGGDELDVGKFGSKDIPEPEQKNRSQRRATEKWFGFTKSKLREIAGFAVLIPWIFVDLLDSHSLPRLLMLAASLVISLWVLFSYCENHLKARIFWIVTIVPLIWIVWNNSRPEPQLDFKISLLAAFKTDGVMYVGGSVPLTNDFLMINPSKEVPFNGVVYIQVPATQSNVMLYVLIRNISPVDAEYPQVAVSITKNLTCEPEGGKSEKDWNPGFGWNFSELCRISGIEYGEQSWVGQYEYLLANNSAVLPGLWFKTTDETNWGAMEIAVQAKKSPIKVLAFKFVFVRKSFPQLASFSALPIKVTKTETNANGRQEFSVHESFGPAIFERKIHQ